MLSVLIPVYQTDVSALVAQLTEQLQNCGLEYEIVVLDDASGEPFQSRLLDINKQVNVRLVRHEVNQGRARSRNRLSKEARYGKLLFLDADSIICNRGYIAKYLEVADSYPVIYGGRSYADDPPDFEYSLRWHYGRQKEMLHVQERMKDPWLTFGANNFLAHKKVLEQIPFDEAITGYGYEDSLWAAELRAAGIGIHHIDNPLLYKVRDTNIDFLVKTEEALQTLRRLVNDGKKPQVRLLRYAHQLEWSRTLPFARSFWGLLSNRYWVRVLNAPHRLRYFQLYKLFYYLTL